MRETLLVMEPQHKYDVFISYSRKDVEFVRKLQRVLVNYTPPRDLPVPQRRLRVFRDESDFQGTEYEAAVEQNLKGASKLLVICSPNSRSSAYVGEEVRTFAELRGKENIVSLLLAGVPNNQSGAAELEKAFHDELVSRLPIPLAADYRGWQSRDRLDRDRFESAWYKILADVYADYGIDRTQIEQREKVRQRRTRRVRAAVASVSTFVLASLTIWALVSRQEAIVQRNTAQSRFLASQSMSGAQTFEMSLLLAAAAFRTSPTAEAWEALLLGLQRQPSIERFLQGHRGVAHALTVSADGACAAASSDDRILVWDLKTGRTRAEIQDAKLRPSVHAFGSDCGALVAGFEDGAVQAWTIGPSPVRFWSAAGNGQRVTAIAVNSRDSVAAVGYADGRLILRGLDTGDARAEVSDVYRFPVSVLKFNSEGTALASVDWQGVVRRWTAGLAADGEPAKCLGSGGTGILALSDDLARCASGAGPPGPVTVTNLKGATGFEGELGGPWILAVDFSHDGRSLLTANQGGELQLWNLDAPVRAGVEPKPRVVWSEHRADVTSVAHNPNDDVFVSSGWDQSVIVWRSSPSDRLVNEVSLGISDFETAVLDASLREAVAANQKGDLFRSMLDEPANPVAIGGFGRPVSALAMREPGREVFGSATGGEVMGRGMDSGEQRSFVAGHSDRIEKLRLNDSGSRLAAAAENGTVTLWDLADGRLIATFPEAGRGGRGGGVTTSVDVAFEPGGDRLVSIHGDNQAFLWQWINSVLRFDPFPLKPTSYFTSIAFSPDRQTVALGTGIYEGGIAVFDSLNSRPAAAVLSGHDQLDVTALAFSPDGRLLLSGGFDSRINLWDVAGLRRIGQAYRASGAVKSLTFAKSGLMAGGVTDRGTVVRWDFDPDHWVAAACRIANRDWTPEERLRLLASTDGEPACPMN